MAWLWAYHCTETQGKRECDEHQQAFFVAIWNNR